MLISKDLIILNMEENTKEDIIGKLTKIAVQQNKVNNADEYRKAVLHRESEYSTAVGFGVAIPHGKTDAVNEPFLMYAKVDGIDWAALDGEPVYHVFLIGVPAKEAGNTHLQILAKLSRKLMKEDFRDNMNKIETEEELLALLEDSEIL